MCTSPFDLKIRSEEKTDGVGCRKEGKIKKRKNKIGN
jgi:hypothetical protein